MPCVPASGYTSGEILAIFDTLKECRHKCCDSLPAPPQDCLCLDNYTLTVKGTGISGNNILNYNWVGDNISVDYECYNFNNTCLLNITSVQPYYQIGLVCPSPPETRIIFNFSTGLNAVTSEKVDPECDGLNLAPTPLWIAGTYNYIGDEDGWELQYGSGDPCLNVFLNPCNITPPDGICVQADEITLTYIGPE